MFTVNTLLNRASRLPRIQKPCGPPLFVRARATLRHSSLLSTLRSQSSPKLTNTWTTVPRLLYTAGIGGIGLGLTTCGSKVHCDCEDFNALAKAINPTLPPSAETSSTHPDLAPPPVSLISYYELSFGTVTGVCAGVFIKKGVKAVAWLFGGIFILLQVGFLAHRGGSCS